MKIIKKYKWSILLLLIIFLLFFYNHKMGIDALKISITNLKEMDFKNINIGELISLKVKEDKIQIDRIQNFFKCEHHDILKMYQSKSLDSEILLKWCKLLKYDFFRLYSHHLILYSIPDGVNRQQKVD